MANWGKTVKAIREAKGLTQVDLANKSGLKLSHISRIEMGDIQSYKEETINKFAVAFGMTTPELISMFYNNAATIREVTAEYDPLAVIKERLERTELISVPVRGYVSAGIPAPAEQMDLGTVSIPKSELSGVKKVSGVFALKVSGDSLQGDQIENGDFVIVDPEPQVIDGKIYIIHMSEGSVARHLHQEDGFVVLTSSNGKYQRIEAKELEVQGRVVLAGNWKRM